MTVSSNYSSRSLEGAEIHAQFIKYASDIDTKIHGIDSLPYERRSLAAVQAERAALSTLKLQLQPIYTRNYENPGAKVAQFQNDCGLVLRQIDAAFNRAMGKQEAVIPEAKQEKVQIQPAKPSIAAPHKVDAVNLDLRAAKGRVPIEHGTWYLDWTSWNYPVPQGVTAVNIFVGTMTLGADNKPVIGGFGNMSAHYNDEFPAYKKMDALIAGCRAQKMAVKISIGGGGGSHDHCWDALTRENVRSFAQALADFCRAHAIDGVDFDYEGTTSPKSGPEQQALVGTLIKEFKSINPKFQTSLCTNAGFGDGFEWPGVVKNIFDGASTIDPHTGTKICAVERLYIMSYDSPLEKEKIWVTGWAKWLNKDYDFTPSQITVGLNNTDHHAYDIALFAEWAGRQGYSTCYWTWDPATMEKSNASTNQILSIYKKATNT